MLFVLKAPDKYRYTRQFLTFNIARHFWMELGKLRWRIAVTHHNTKYLVFLVFLLNFLVSYPTNSICIHCLLCETSKVSWVCGIKNKKKRKRSPNITSCSIMMYIRSVTLVYLILLLFKLLLYLGISNIVQDQLITVDKIWTKKIFLQIGHVIIHEEGVVL